eukprot:m.79590 g.79590  ORF g.79590 m.79590 type:complete len:378 (-) comp25231_c0_seq1:25-1158(-)
MDTAAPATKDVDCQRNACDTSRKIQTTLQLRQSNMYLDQSRQQAQQSGLWRNIFSNGKKKDRKENEDQDSVSTQIQKPASKQSLPRKLPTTFLPSDIKRPVHVRGYGEGLLMYYGVYHKTGMMRAGIAFNRAIGLNNGTVLNRLYFKCPPNHGVLVKPSKVSFLSEQQTLDAIQSGMLLDPSKIATMSLGPAQQNPKDVEGSATKPSAEQEEGWNENDVANNTMANSTMSSTTLTPACPLSSTSSKSTSSTHEGLIRRPSDVVRRPSQLSHCHSAPSSSSVQSERGAKNMTPESPCVSLQDSDYDFDYDTISVSSTFSMLSLSLQNLDQVDNNNSTNSNIAAAAFDTCSISSQRSITSISSKISRDYEYVHIPLDCV